MELSVNGRRHEVEAAALTPLLDLLRDELGFTGTKDACREGRCGACTVLVDGEAVVSCLFPAGLAAGREVTTVEGLAAADGTLSNLQSALLEAGGVQCGACTPGMLISLTALLRDVPGPDEAQVRAAIAGNVCRCTGYQKIVDATLAAASAEAGR